MRKRLIGPAVAAATAITAGVLATAFPAAASAGTTDSTGIGPGTGGWTPVTYQSLEYTAGDVCSFALKEEFPTQSVEQRIAATYPDGSPLRTDFRGPLIAHYTNEATGAQVDEDLSGVGTLYNLPDKARLWTVPDNVGLTVHAGDPYHAQGEYVLSGGEVIAISPTDQIAVLHQTKVIDVCAALS